MPHATSQVAAGCLKRNHPVMASLPSCMRTHGLLVSTGPQVRFGHHESRSHVLLLEKDGELFSKNLPDDITVLVVSITSRRLAVQPVPDPMPLAMPLMKAVS